MRNAGAIPFLSLGSDSSSGGSGYTDAQIAGGSQDAYLTQFAQAAKAWGHPFFLRFDWEMNGNWMPWGVGLQERQHGRELVRDVAARARHLHRRRGDERELGVVSEHRRSNRFAGSMARLTRVMRTSIGRVWMATTATCRGPASMTCSRPVTATSRADRAVQADDRRRDRLTESGGWKAQWITNMLSDLPTSFPKIRGLVWYDESVSGPGGHSDWPIESSSRPEAAFASGIKSSTYTTNSYANLNTSPIPPPA